MKRLKTKNNNESADKEAKQFFTTDDGRKVEYLDNPLPVPLKHINKDMDFDYETDINDDFDID